MLFKYYNNVNPKVVIRKSKKVFVYESKKKKMAASVCNV